MHFDNKRDLIGKVKKFLALHPHTRGRKSRVNSPILTLSLYVDSFPVFIIDNLCDLLFTWILSQSEVYL